jgi:Fe-S oxidoreductase
MVPLPVALNPKFTDACPPSRLFNYHGYSGSGKQIMAMSLLDGRIEADQKLADIVYACHACGYCDVACKFIMDAERHRINMALREVLAEQGLAPSSIKRSMENLKTHGHVAKETRRSPGAWAEGLGLKVLPEEKADVLLFAGCIQRNDDRSAEVARKLARLLIHAEMDIGILGDSEPCCGLPAYWAGYRSQYADMAEENTKLLERTGAKKIVVSSGSCLGSFRSKYPEYARKPDVETLHATELLQQLITDGRLNLPKPIKKKVTYHDPCYLGRQSEPYVDWKGEEKTTLGVMTYKDPPKPICYGTDGVYDAPRAILQAIKGLEFKEMYRIREYSYCCGAGGGATQSYPELARSATMHRIEEARDVGAELLVTACAHCEMQFTSLSENGMPAVDVIDLVYEAAEVEG